MTDAPATRLTLAIPRRGRKEGVILAYPEGPAPSNAPIEGAHDFHRHGGRLHAAKRLWPMAPQPWIDLSTGINPLPYPAPRATPAERARLPDPERLAGLEAAAAAAFGVADPGRVVAVAGAETALRLAPLALGATAVAIAEPTYGGHAQAWAAAGASVLPWPAAEDDVQVVVVVNPNNPDGRTLAPSTLLALADRLRRRGGWLVVDESFVETEPELSVARSGHPAIVVLRSFGKMYGLAGLRLGFGVAEPAMATRFRRLAGDWPVSADAMVAGLVAYADSGWLIRARRRLAHDAAGLDAALTAAGYDVVGGTSLFRLARAQDAEARFARLCAHGVLTRPFAWDRALLRFGLPHPRVRGRVARALRAAA